MHASTVHVLTNYTQRELLLDWNIVRKLGDFYLGADALTKVAPMPQ